VAPLKKIAGNRSNANGLIKLPFLCTTGYLAHTTADRSDQSTQLIHHPPAMPGFLWGCCENIFIRSMVAYVLICTEGSKKPRAVVLVFSF
jgi:hypothetical protein